MGRRVGVEEEFLLVDAGTGRATLDGPAVAAAADEQTELQRQQVETGTAPHTDLADVRADLTARRARVAALAADSGSRLLALATHPLPTEPVVTEGDRYQRLVEAYGLLAREQLTCGCHVHVEVPDRDEAVAVLDRVRPWTAVLLALSSNSPFWQGEESGYASYRARVWDRWPTAGPTPAFGDAAGYDRAAERLLATGVPLDPGQLYYDVRVSATQPTVEVRVADVCLRAGDAVLLAGLARALVETAAREAADGRGVPDVSVAELRAASWRASHDGLGGVLVSPRSGRPASAAEVVRELVDHVAPVLREDGDEGFVTEGLAGLARRGTGADWQRAAAASSGPAGMVARAVEVTQEG
ncbi:carboxylate-amine ligase [Kineococcus rhizosphaerae]|uniref:Putative glutamate--cysteine ligase 2 n=1 Tax=Kineococcus rhizosphaerae TaxID=559628 RepID=A0A2T0R2K7_9ACTN|nr:glutamate--cysteine ligase [Kineococcus rhizosphaerae]PRY14039.1 carboxylate-amine ligase [Kineococcus rhizosphaerae]